MLGLKTVYKTRLEKIGLIELPEKKFRRLTEFAGKSKGSVDDKAVPNQAGSMSLDSGKKDVDKDSDNTISELVNVLMQRFKTGEKEGKATAKKNLGKEGVDERRISKDLLADKLGELIKTAISRTEVKVIECNQQGVCSDGKKIGEVFEDEKGVKWQRGFLNTTRLPIFLDFIAENAVIKGKIGRAYVIETSRGTEAIVPEDFICEMTSRYGVLLDIDKCVNYRVSPWTEKGQRGVRAKK